jgi:membrane-bound lytic murein transglycosylase D
LKQFFYALALLPVLWLAGCATTGPADQASTRSSTATAGSGASLPDTPDSSVSVYPGGGLKPLASEPSLRSRSVQSLSPPVDLWERVRGGFAMPDLDSDLVRERELWYSSRPDYVARMTERGSKYLFYIVEELERRDMPSELALLPFIESAFNPQAVSSAKAAGMWQFMPATGKYFELKQNMFRDDRRDVIESTRAALDYLQKLHRMFGDWHLALAAYNWGEGSVQRAIKKAKNAGTGTRYEDLVMPMETRMYVPKLQAVKNIVATPQSFRVTLPDIGNHPYFQSVEIERDIDVALAAELAGVPLADFRALNPSANKPVLLAASNSQILLPWDNAELFQSKLSAYNGGRLANWTAWVAPTTLNPAEAARRVGMNEDELRSVNNIPPRMNVKAGSTLLVRRSASLNSDVTEHVANNGYLTLAPDVVLRKTVVKAGKKDNVASMARRFSVSAQVLADWNKVSTSASFKRGQSVVLYLPAKARVKGSAKTRGKAVSAKSVKRAPVKAAAKKKPVKRARQ